MPASWSVFDIPGKEVKIARLEKEASQADFWADQQVAQKAMQNLSLLREEVALWRGMAARTREALELLELVEIEEDEEVIGEVAEELEALERELEDEEFQLTLSGPHDRGNALLAVHAGAGGTEAQDWAEMLLRMFLRWAEHHDYKTTILDSMTGEEAGLKSATVEVEGPYAYGYLRAEKGVHRLVRLSPFDAAQRRHTSFALVEVMPVIDDAVEIEINPDDLRMDVFRSSGAGGQNVQKNATAVRLTHIPTGMVVTCQNERSQLQNRESALKVLRSRLYEREMERRAAEQEKLKGEHVDAGWGNQIRSYVLHPYQMVKDHRTEVETGKTSAVLDGDLDMFIKAYLKSQVGKAGD